MMIFSKISEINHKIVWKVIGKSGLKIDEKRFREFYDSMTEEIIAIKEKIDLERKRA